MENQDGTFGQGYNLEDREEFFDTNKGSVVEQKDLTPWEIIKATAVKLGYTINDPKKGCKHCYGRGYLGIMAGTKQPIPCNCIYSIQQKKDSEKQSNPAWNRSVRRNPVMRKEIRKRLAAMKQLNELTKNQISTSATTNEPVVQNWHNAMKLIAAAKKMKVNRSFNLFSLQNVAPRESA
jgi:hypothetical protein